MKRGWRELCGARHFEAVDSYDVFPDNVGMGSVDVC